MEETSDEYPRLLKRLKNILATQLKTNFHDRKWFRHGEKRTFACSKNMTDLILPRVLESCASMNYNFSELSFQTVVKNLCGDMERVLDWSFAACTKRERTQSLAGGRAKSYKKKTNNVCRRIKSRMEKDLQSDHFFEKLPVFKNCSPQI